MATLLEKFVALNQSDLSGLQKRIDDLRKAAEAELARQKKAGASVATEKEIQAAAATAGVSVNEFMSALEYAKRMGMI